MADAILRLNTHEVLRALDRIDLLDLLTGEFAGDEPSVGGAGSGPTVIEQRRAGVRCLLPDPALRVVRAAGMAALAARELLAPGGVTATVFDAGVAVRLLVTLLARYVPTLTHLALRVPDAGAVAGMSAFDELEPAGISVSIASGSDAMFGANLLVLTDPDACVSLRPPTTGMLVVNATGTDLPREVMDGIDQVYVDDLRLLPANRHREFVKLHLTGHGAHTEPLHAAEGWHRHRATWRHQRRVEADLAAVLAGRCPGRTHDDDVLLVELLGVPDADGVLGHRLVRAAVESRLGQWSDAE